MTNTLITRTFLDSDGIQKIAIFDTAQKPADDELGLFIDDRGRDDIVPACKHYDRELVGKLIFIGKILL